MTRILGIDPGLRHTGWGMVHSEGSTLRHLGCGIISPDDTLPMAERLMALHRGLAALLAEWQPDEAAIENTYVNRNPAAALKLGQARGIALLAPALVGIPVAEYQAMEVKRAVVGTGAAAKEQVADMVRRLLPGARLARADAADALAIAICHTHHRATRLALARGYVPA
ncbi:crossover junction endodeoxyribonuclease RuvC [Plastoroseomonas arctica]|uniref:Crossover junction endodeoxyribonuclease RuvC n=1 Tax=Plastoroseomonas arctica TaxID=1509237 RepID=A0AAF1JY49_9PROT|nr:crossover junction endodeoxyribonuclease RuvC [Plastoroseomonas arctica]